MKWRERLGRQFAIYGGSTDATYPRSKPGVTCEDEVEEAPESQPPNDYPQTAPSQPTVFRLDARTEQETPITLDATHASMTVDDTRLTNMSPRVGCLVLSQLAEKVSLKQPSAFLWQ